MDFTKGYFGKYQEEICDFPKISNWDELGENQTLNFSVLFIGMSLGKPNPQF